VDFPEASSARSAGPYDVLFVEGSVSEPAHLERIVELRRRTRFLVTIGACATAGGIQALRNWGDHDSFRLGVYAHPEWVASLARSTPIAEHVAVDAELRGCPIDPGQLVELLTALTTGRRPQLRDEAVCMECKRSGVVCVMVSKGIACLGQVTQTGCGAICPRYGRGCYGCFGPREQANAAGLTRHLQMAGDRPPEEIGRLFAGFTAYAEPFRSMVTELGGARTGRGTTSTAAEPAPRGGQA
jgi:coenzyme F420-reducing hydrogenase gamma subunit